MVCATLLAAHVITLPVPATDDVALVEAIHERPAGWTVLHALASECRCSGAVLEHIFSTDRPAGVAETILLVGPTGDVPRRAAERGFAFVSLTAEELSARYGIPAAPLLVVAGPDGVVRYAGGYTARKQGPEVQDLEILADALAGRSPQALPLFGCPVNTDLAATLDPLSVR